MIVILLLVIVLCELISIRMDIQKIKVLNATIDHLKGIDAKTITAVADVGDSLSRSDEVEWQIEQDKLREEAKQLIS